MSRKKIYLLILIILSLIVYAWTVNYRLGIADELKIDFDEPIYTCAASDIAPCIYSLNITCLRNYTYNYEHPMLGKIIYGLFLNYNASLEEKIMVARKVDIYLSSLTVIILTFINPLSGILFSGDALVTKYSSQAYLDALTTLFVLLSYTPLLYHIDKKPWLKTTLSSIFGGAAIATKYTAIPALLPIIIYLFTKIFIDAIRLDDRVVLYIVFKPKYFLYAIVWLMIGAGTFILLNPMFWNDLGKPIEETMLYKSLIYHVEYASKTSIEKPLPTYHQFTWIIEESPLKWHPGIPWINTGLIILFLGYLGLPLTIYKKPLIGGWIISYTIFLLIWLVKWPQYTLLLLAPLSISASYFIVFILKIFKNTWSKINSIDTEKKLSIIIISIILLSIPISIMSKETIAISSDKYLDRILETRETRIYRDKILIRTDQMEIIFSKEGLKPISWRVDDYELLNSVQRGTAKAYPYEWIPRNNYPWPGEIYYSCFNVYSTKNYIVGYTKLERDAEGLIFYKFIRIINSTCIEIRYILYNPTNDEIEIGSDPRWGKGWGFSIELTISPNTTIDNIKQYYRTCSGETIYKHSTWVSIETSCILEYGLIDYNNDYKIYIVNLNNTQTTALWLEYGSKWISIRLSYKNISLKRGESIVYTTRWCIDKIREVDETQKLVFNLTYKSLEKTYYMFTYILLFAILIIYGFLKETIKIRILG
ncbi:MAG: hypothetical protein B6U89_04990 [Desulfurococcales archaeon ex4484_58]|nr:MAG: hypothetical protein B6U89_04990 [Desulfurococcales archaeon ex4484_58]